MWLVSSSHDLAEWHITSIINTINRSSSLDGNLSFLFGGISSHPLSLSIW